MRRALIAVGLLAVFGCQSSTAPNTRAAGLYNLQTVGGVKLPSAGWTTASVELEVKGNHYLATCNGLGCDAGTWSVDGGTLTLSSVFGREWQATISNGSITVAGNPWAKGSAQAMVFAR